MTIPVTVRIEVSIGELGITHGSTYDVKSDAELIAATRAEAELDRVYEHVRAVLAANKMVATRQRTNRERKPGKVDPDSLEMQLTDKERAEALKILHDDT